MMRRLLFLAIAGQHEKALVRRYAQSESELDISSFITYHPTILALKRPWEFGIGNHAR